MPCSAREAQTVERTTLFDIAGNLYKNAKGTLPTVLRTSRLSGGFVQNFSMFASGLFPGPHSPGLIEASNNRGPHYLGPQNFRGLTAPASLKLSKDMMADELTTATFPGPHSPGLIEAG